jgi:hypothetical protein
MPNFQDLLNKARGAVSGAVSNVTRRFNPPASPSWRSNWPPPTRLQQSVAQTERDAAAAATRIRQNQPAANPLTQLVSGAAGLASLSPLAGVMFQSGIRSVNTLIDPQTGLVPTVTRLVRGVGNFAQGRPYEAPSRGADISSSIRGFIGPTQDIYEQPGVGYFDRRSGRFLGRGNAGQQSTGGGGGGPAERAYRQEVSRTAQLAAQNPELTRYEKDAADAKASGDQARMDAVRDQGMAIWAAKYGKPDKYGKPGLASRVKPGQSGYDVIQRTLYPQGAPLPPLSPAAQGMLDAVAPVNSQGIRPDITPMPGQLPAFGTASEAMYQAVTDGGRLVTPMSAPAAPTPQAAAAQNLVDIYKGEITGDDEFAKRLRAMQQYIQ